MIKVRNAFRVVLAADDHVAETHTLADYEHKLLQLGDAFSFP